MAICPDRESLQRLIEGHLSQEQTASLEGHVESCSRCQRFLDHLTASVLPAELDEALHRLSDNEPRKPSVPDIELLELIGRGSSAQVWKGRLLDTQQLVAVKVCTSAPNDAEIARFQREIEILARLNHPNLIRLYHAGPISEGYYFSMEYIPAKSVLDVRARFAAQRQMPNWSIPQIAAMVRDVALAVHHAHDNQILHRDLKPGNILLAEGDVPKVADFGLGKLMDGSTRTTMGPAGTPSYMAPEQVRGEPSTVRTDVYGLGALLFDWLTGQPPIPASESHVGTMQRVLDVVPVSPRNLRPEIPADLEQITLKCLYKISSDRYVSAKGLADDLQRFLDHRPVVARPISVSRRTWRWAKRNRLTAALSAGLVFAIFISLIITTILWRRAEGKADDARRATEAALRSRNAAREALMLYSTSAERLYRDGVGITAEDRQALAQAANRTLEQLEADGDDPEQEFKVAWSILKLAESMQNVNEYELAEQLTAKVVTVIRRLAVNTEDRRKIHNLAQAEAGYANMQFQIGRHEDAIALSQIAERRIVELFDKYPELYGYQITLASMRWHQGQYFQKMGRYSDALKSYEASLPDMRALLRRLPTNPERLREFLMVCELYAETLFIDPKHRQQALAVMQESAAELDRFRATAPKERLNEFHDFGCYVNLASVQYRLGRVDDALATIQRQVELTREYRKYHPDQISALSWYVGAVSTLGELEWPSKPASAAARFREAWAILQDAVQQRPNKDVYMMVSAFLTTCSDPMFCNPKLAAENARKAEQLDPKDSRVRMCLVHALVANRQYREALEIPEMALPKGEHGWNSDLMFYALARIEALFHTGEIAAARELFAIATKVADREMCVRWDLLSRIEKLRKQLK